MSSKTISNKTISNKTITIGVSISIISIILIAAIIAAIVLSLHKPTPITIPISSTTSSIPTISTTSSTSIFPNVQYNQVFGQLLPSIQYLTTQLIQPFTLNNPLASISYANSIFILDSGDGRICSYANDLDNLHAIVQFPSGFNGIPINNSPSSNTLSTTASGIAFDSNGNLYVSDTGYNRILLFEINNSNTYGIPSYYYGQNDNPTTQNSGTSNSTFRSPAGICIDINNGLYVADSGNNRVLYFPFNSSTNVIDITASIVYGQVGFVNFTSSSSGNQFNLLNNPTDVSVSSSSNKLYISDSGNNRIVIWNLTGSPIPSIIINNITNGIPLSRQLSCCIDGNQNLYVCDTINNRVLFYANLSLVTNINGNSITSTINPSGIIGQNNYTDNGINGGLIPPNLNGISFNHPSNVRVNLSPGAIINAIYVTDSGNNRVLKYTPS